MTKARKPLALLFVLCFVLSALVGCQQPAPSAAPSGAADSAAPGSSAAAEPTKAATGEVKPCLYVTPGNTFPNQDTVLAAVNKQMQADGVNVAVSFKRIPWDGFLSKLNLMLSTGEEFDMMHVMQDIENLSVLRGMNAIVPIDKYLPNYPDLVSKFTDLMWAQGKVNGETYAVPANWQEFSMIYGNLTYREDVFKKVQPDGVFPKDFDGFYDLCVKMQAEIKAETGKTAYMWIHQVTDSLGWLHRTYDDFPFFVDRSNELTKVAQDGTVASYFESDTFKKDAAAYRKMFQGGLIDPDVLSVTPQKKYDDEKIGAFLPSATFSYDDEIPLQKNIATSTIAQSVLAPEKPWLQYCSIQNLNAMSATSRDPESGLKFLQWLYNKKENHDLFCYGIEGTDYTASAANRIKSTLGADNNALYAFDTWMIGYLPYMRFDEATTQKGIDYKTKAATADQVVLSPVVGFQFDATTVKNELTNIQQVVTTSFYPIKYGLVDYDAAYSEALKNLKAAGIDKYIAEYQKQLTAFLASKK